LEENKNYVFARSIMREIYQEERVVEAFI